MIHNHTNDRLRATVLVLFFLACAVFIPPFGRTQSKQTDDLEIVPLQQVGSDTYGKLFGLRHMKIHSGAHGTNFDALIFIPREFDSAKPTNIVIHNHGWWKPILECWNYYHLGEQMNGCDSQTLVILPEWQEHAGTGGRENNASSEGALSRHGMYERELREIFAKTPGLSRLRLADVAKIAIISHSAGYVPTATMLEDFGNKVTMLAMFDSLYSREADKWIARHKADIATGRKQYIDIFNSQTRVNSEDQLQKFWNGQAGSLLRMTAQVVPKTELEGHSVIYIDSSALAANTDDAHYAIPQQYFGTVVSLLPASRKSRHH